MNLIDKILKESINVGDVLFGEDPDILKFTNNKYEENTKLEDKIFKSIKDYVIYFSNKTDLNKYFDELNKIKNKFPEILKPTTDIIYRGFMLDADVVLPIINKNGIKIFNDKYYILKKEINYVSHQTLSSWTAKFNIAEKFARNMPDSSAIKIIAETTTDNDFLFNPAFLNLINKKVETVKEFEIITNKKNISCKIYIDKKDYDRNYKQKK